MAAFDATHSPRTAWLRDVDDFGHDDNAREEHDPEWSRQRQQHVRAGGHSVDVSADVVGKQDEHRPSTTGAA